MPRLSRWASIISLLVATFSAGSGIARPGDPPVPGESGQEEKEQPGMYDAWHQPVLERVVLSRAENAVDNFGYQLETGLALDWIDATSGTEVVFPANRDDDYSGAVPLGFDFPFYENSYNQLYVGTNGILTFKGGSASFNNQLLPLDPLPNNLVAAFWDDLDLQSGKVYYQRLDTLQGKSLVVEWYQVFRFSSAMPMTFEVILHDDGDILLQYLSMNGITTSATIGIEDCDGVDGLTYLFNASGLASGQAIRFSRPAPGPRVKVLPVYQSSFTIQRAVAFEAQIRNTSPFEDVFDLEASLSAAGWQASLFAENGTTALNDTDGDGLLDTGSLNPGESIMVVLQVLAPEDGQPGDYTQIELTATTSNIPAASAAMDVQVAVPADFAQGYADSQAGLFVDLVSKESLTTSKTSNFFTGNTVSLTDTGQNGYLFAWERNGQKTIGQELAYFTDIEYILLNRQGEQTRSITKLTRNGDLATPTLMVNARYPALAEAPSGRIGVVWVQYQLGLSPPYESRANVYLAILDSSGELAFGPRNVTQAGLGMSAASGSSPAFTNPRIAATTDNRFLLSWIDVRYVDTEENSAVFTAVYSAAGEQVLSPKAQATAVPGKTLLMDPALADLSGGRVLLAYSIFDEQAKTYKVAYTILRSDGGKDREIQVIANSSGWRSDAVQLKNGNILLAWTNPKTGRLARAVLEGNGSQLILPPSDLPLVGGRLPDFVSLAGNRQGRAVLTWMDAEWKDYLYYAQVDPAGGIITPPMIFLRGKADDPLLQTSFYGQGIAAWMADYENFIPAILNKR